MKHISLVKAVNKLNLTVNNSDKSQFYVKYNGKTLSWFRQEDSAKAVSVYKDSDPSDATIDYFPQIYVNTVKSAIEYLTKK